MASANINKDADPEKQLLNSASLPTSPHPDPRSKEVNRRSITMARTQRFSVGLLLLLTLIITFVSASRNHASRVSAEEREKFQELLNSVEPSSLHNVLHEHLAEKYQDGVYQEDRAAMEVVHQSNVEVAHSLLELAKRQSSNSTTSTPPSSTSTPSSTPTTSTTVAPTSSGSSQTSAQSSTTVASTTASQTPTQSQTTQSQTSQSPSQVTQDQSSTQQTSDQSTTPVQSSSTSPSSLESTSSTTPQSSTNGAGTTKTSSTPTTSGNGKSSSAKGSVTQQTIYTTTLAGGAVSTITSVTVVPADQAEATGTSSKTGKSASLQTNVANPMGMGLGGVLGAVGLVVIGAL